MDNNSNVEKKTPKMPKVWQSLVVLLFLVAMLAVGIIIFGVDPHVPMLLGVMGAALMAMILGYSWEDTESFMIKGISKAMQSIMILIVIGVLIGVWLDAGVVPTMIYYGLKVLHPSIFFVASVIICSITSLATGTSWGTMGTMGVALMGIGFGLGMDPGMTAGAIISGAYFGDKMSPLSDTTNLAPAMAGTDLMSHIKFMLKPTLVVYVITLAAFGVLGYVTYSGGNADLSNLNQLSTTLKGMFNINPFLLLPPVLVILLVAMKVPAIPGITAGILIGGAMGMIFQDNCTLGSLFACGMNGFSCKTDNDIINELFNKGGLMNMTFSISMTIIAMMFGGIMEETRMLEVIVSKLKKIVKRPTGLVGLTEVTCIASNAIMPEQYISLVVPGRMYAEEYEKMGLSATTLSNALESSGTVTSALIPWNTCGVFIVGTLDVGVLSYAPWAIFNWLMPIACLVMAYLGLTIADKNGVSLRKKKKLAKQAAEQ